MSDRFTECPGEDCQSKVKIHVVEDGTEEINFCCVPCFQYTWANMVDTEHRMPHEHSDQCAWRQLSRVHEPVCDGEFKIHVPKVIPGGPPLP